MIRNILEEIYGIYPTGNKIKVIKTARVHFENGKAFKNWENIDSLGFMQQLGMELKPKEAEKK